MSDKRIFAIINDNDNYENVANEALDFLMSNDSIDEVYVFTKSEKETFRRDVLAKKVMNKVIPDTCDNSSKVKNFVNKTFKDMEFKGFLHVIEDNVKFNKDPSEFIKMIEKTMDVLDYPVWLNTACDGCNYIYKKYNPRLEITLDEPSVFNLSLPSHLYFTSHSNTSYVIYDFSKVPDDLLKFDERYTIAMYRIIEFLARRRNTKTNEQLYFMNQYMTIPEEHGVFETVNLSEESLDQNKMKEEDAIFKSSQIDFRPDNDIDKILEMTWNKLKSKISV